MKTFKAEIATLKKEALESKARSTESEGASPASSATSPTSESSLSVAPKVVRTRSRRSLPVAGGGAKDATKKSGVAAEKGAPKSGQPENAAAAPRSTDELLPLIRGRTLRSVTLNKGDKGIGISLQFKEGTAKSDPRRGVYVKSLQVSGRLLR